MQGEVVLKVFRGTVNVYERQAGKGFIALDGEDVPVDLAGSRGVRLAVGMQVEFQMIHRPEGVFAFAVKVIPQVLE